MSLGRAVVLLVVLFVAAAMAPPTHAQGQPLVTPTTMPPLPEVIRVGVREAPPFTYLQPTTGRWKGLSVDLWHAVTFQLQLDRGLDAPPYRTEFVVVPFADVASALSRPETPGQIAVDVLIAPLTITEEREQAYDYTHQYFPSGLAFALPKVSGINLGEAVDRFVEALRHEHVLPALGLVLAATLLFAVAAFSASQAFRSRDIAEGPARERALVFTVLGALKATGIDREVFGFRSFLMLALSLVLLVFGTIISASITGVITAALTLSAMDTEELDVSELHDQRFGVVAGSTHEAYLRELAPDMEPTLLEASQRRGLEKLLAGDIDVFVGDEAQLRYLVAKPPFRDKLEVQPRAMTFEPIGWALPAGSPYREPLNAELLGVLRSEAWPGLVAEYFGD